MTMSHLLKQTKKCCAKIIRKLSFNPSGTPHGPGANESPTGNNGHGLNNRITAKYVLHKNCTPTRCKVQPRDGQSFAGEDGDLAGVPIEGWMETRLADGAGGVQVAASRSSSPTTPPPAIPETQNNYRLSRSMKNLPRKRTNITSNKNVNQLRKCFRLRSKTFDALAAASLESQNAPTAEGQPITGGSSLSIVEQHVVERREVPPANNVAAATATINAPDSLTLASNNSSSRLIGAKLDKISKSLMRSMDGGGGGGGGMEGPEGPAEGLATKITKPLFLSTSKHRRSNYNHIEIEDEDDIVPALRMTRSSVGDEGTLEPPDGGLILAQGWRGEPARTHRLEQETTLTTMVEQSTPSVLERLTVAETAAAILFEKVKYDRTKRYLIDQLTDNGGAGGGGGGGGGGTPSSSSCCSSPFHLAKSDDFVDPWKNYNIRGGTGWDKVSKSPWDSSAKASPVRTKTSGHLRTPPAASVQQPQQQPTTYQRSHWNPFEYSPAHLARLTQTTSQQHQQQQQQQQQQYRPAFQVQTDVWENLNCKQYEIDTDVVWRSTRCSSRRTSASTVETWIDDETFDNSFNEELERRCATLAICE
ncbi:uncharacterized protein LOC128726666 [Anopheles nili]|uniref:uncharacterized protein LOC128726666 n=1 Tax=Anopheles nili TaxID=185578 RepID=UPI00237C1E7D|nr:uncharacterized protein LOC128726666 [Anopheles nili]